VFTSFVAYYRQYCKLHPLPTPQAAVESPDAFDTFYAVFIFKPATFAATTASTIVRPIKDPIDAPHEIGC